MYLFSLFLIKTYTFVPSHFRSNIRKIMHTPVNPIFTVRGALPGGYITIISLCNILRIIMAVKMVIFRLKLCFFLLIFPLNVDCGYTLGGSNEYPQSMF